MPVRVAEYLGHTPTSHPVPWQPGKPIPDCPFNGMPCAKVARNPPQKPVCSVWSNDRLWITCEERLLTAKRNVPVTHGYVALRIAEIAEILWPSSSDENLAVSRQHPIISSKADYIFAVNPQWRVIPVPVRYCMEIQGGGPTNQTGTLTRHVTEWEDTQNIELNAALPSVGPDIRGVWKRLLEQLFTKGLAAIKLRQGIGCVVGDTLFDAVDDWIKWSDLKAPKDGFIDFIVVPYRVSDRNTSPLTLEPDNERIIRSTFETFLDHIRRTGLDADFSGRYTTFGGEEIKAT